MVHVPRQCMDCPIIIYDQDKKFIAETVVTGYGKDEMYIEVSEGLGNTATGTLLRLLVIHPDGVSEFAGKLVSKRQGIFEISIHGQRWRDARSSKRFSFHIPATISTFIVDSEVVRLTTPLNVTILNISSTGLMLESKDLPLAEGISLNLEFKLRSRNTVMLCRVIREPSEGSPPDQFGCKIIFPK